MGPRDRAPGPSPRRTPSLRRQSDVSYQDLGRVERRTGRLPGRTRSRSIALAVLVALLVLMAAGGSALVASFHRQSRQSEAAALRPPDHAVLFVVSGATPADFRLVPMPNVAALSKQGITYSSAWVGQLQATPTSSGATITTGVYPREHGIVGVEWRDVHTRTVFSSADPTGVRLGSLDQILESRGVTSLVTLIKSRYPSGHVLAVGGAGCASASAAATWAADYVLCPLRGRGRWRPGGVVGHAPPAGLLAGPSWTVPVARLPGLAPAVEGWQLGKEDDWIARVAVRVMRQSLPRLTIVSFPEVANLAHWVPSTRRAAVLGQLMQGIDGDIGMVLHELRRERNYGRSVFVITSDGGVAPATARVSQATLNEAILASGGEEVYLDADGSAMIGVRDRLEALPVAQAIQAEHLRPVDAIYYKDQGSSGWAYRPQYLNPELPSAFADATGYLLWTLASDAAPDVAVLYAPGATTGDRQLGRYHWTGVGRGAQWDTQHIPLLIAGHGVVAGARSGYPARLVDIAPTIETAMQLGSARVDGVPLADALLRPSARDKDRQRKTGEWLQSFVSVLMQRAHQQGG